MTTVLATTLRTARHRRGLAVCEAARRAGVSDRAIRNAESGRNQPYPRTLRRLALVYGVDPADLLALRRPPRVLARAIDHVLLHAAEGDMTQTAIVVDLPHGNGTVERAIREAVSRGWVRREYRRPVTLTPEGEVAHRERFGGGAKEASHA